MQLYVHARACFKKNSSLHIWPKNFSTTFFRILPQNCTFYFSKILMTFLIIALFYHFLPSRVLQMMTPISYCLHIIHTLTPCIHTRMLFFTFLHLALCSHNSEYYICHLFILNSSLHKRPFITAHFRSSVHILCITAH